MIEVKAAIAVGSSALAWVIAIQVATAKPGQIWKLGPIEIGPRGWLAAGAVLTATAVGMPIIDQYRANRTALAETTKRIFTINSVLTPCTKLLSQLTDKQISAHDKKTSKGEVKAYILAGLKELLKNSGDIRSSFLKVVDGEERSLQVDGQYGRPPSNPSESNLSKQFIEYMLWKLDKGESWVCPDTKRNPPEGWNHDQNDARSLIAVPVASPHTTYGLLLVDSPTTRGLVAADVPVVILFSQLLATAMNG